MIMIIKIHNLATKNLFLVLNVIAFSVECYVWNVLNITIIISHAWEMSSSWNLKNKNLLKFTGSYNWCLSVKTLAQLISTFTYSWQSPAKENSFLYQPIGVQDGWQLTNHRPRNRQLLLPCLSALLLPAERQNVKKGPGLVPHRPPVS